MAVWGCLQLDFLMPVRMAGSEWVTGHCETGHLRKTCFLTTFTLISADMSLFYQVFRQNTVLSDQCASILRPPFKLAWNFLYLRPLDSYLVQKWRFKYVFNDFQLNWDSQQGRVRTTSVKVKKRLGTSNFRPKRLSRVSKNPVFQAKSIGGLRSMHTGRKLRFFDEKRR